MTFDENGIYVNSKGVEITKEQYGILSERASDVMLDRFDEKILKSLLGNKIKEDIIYVVSTSEIDKNGNVIKENSVITTKFIAELVAKDKSICVDDDGIIKKHNMAKGYPDDFDAYHPTTSKFIGMNYYCDTGCTIKITAGWFSLPLVRKYDVIAARWTASQYADSIYGSQDSDVGMTIYDINSNHVKSTANGLGLSVNLYDNATKNINIELFIYGTYSFGQVYATYQHARNSNATLAISKSYSFSSSGLGGVLYYSNSTYRSYYDGMQGISVV